MIHFSFGKFGPCESEQVENETVEYKAVRNKRVKLNQVNTATIETGQRGHGNGNSENEAARTAKRAVRAR